MGQTLKVRSFAKCDAIVNGHCKVSPVLVPEDFLLGLIRVCFVFNSEKMKEDASKPTRRGVQKTNQTQMSPKLNIDKGKVKVS